MAGGNYERGMYNQLMDVMARLGKVEREAAETHRKDQEEIRELKMTVKQQQETIERLTDEVARLQSKDRNDSHNSSLPPSTDQKTGKEHKSANELTDEQRQGKRAEDN